MGRRRSQGRFDGCLTLILAGLLIMATVVGIKGIKKQIVSSSSTGNISTVYIPGRIEMKSSISYTPKIEKIRVIKTDTPNYGVCIEKGPTYWKNYLSNLEGATEEEKAWLLRIAMCESTLHNCSKNKRSSASGLFQYLTSTYRSATKHLSNPPSIWNGEFQTKLALNAYRGGQANAWVCN